MSKYISRIEEVIAAILGEGEITSSLLSRLEKILEAIKNDARYGDIALSRSEEILLCILEGRRYDGPSISRIEKTLEAIANEGTYDGPIISRVEEMLIRWLGDDHEAATYKGTLPATLLTRSGYLKDYKIYGNTVEQSYNLANPADLVLTFGNTATFSMVDDNYFTLNGGNSGTDNRVWSRSYANLKVTLTAGTYTLVAFLDKNTNNRYSAMAYGIGSRTFARTDDGFLNAKSRVWFGPFTLDTESTIWIEVKPYGGNVAIMLTEGDTIPTTFVPYGASDTGVGVTTGENEPSGYKIPVTSYIDNVAEIPIPEECVRLSIGDTTFIKDEDGYITLNSSSDSRLWSWASANIRTVPMTAGTYTLSIDFSIPTDNGYASWAAAVENGDWLFTSSDGNLRNITHAEHTFTLASDCNIFVMFKPYEGHAKITITSTQHAETETNIYIGADQLADGEYIDSQSGKIYRLVNGVLTPTTPPQSLPMIPTYSDETVIDYAYLPKPKNVEFTYTQPTT